VLTSISVVILPLTLIASIWGMNVKVPGQDNLADFFVVIGVMFLILIGMVAWFKRRGWL
jgi:magnesium transporter